MVNIDELKFMFIEKYILEDNISYKECIKTFNNTVDLVYYLRTDRALNSVMFGIDNFEELMYETLSVKPIFDYSTIVIVKPLDKNTFDKWINICSKYNISLCFYDDKEEYFRYYTVNSVNMYTWDTYRKNIISGYFYSVD